MLDIGWSELLVIGVVALIVVGPKDLPMMFRTLGRFTAKARSMGREFQRAMDDAARESGVTDSMKDLKGLTSKKGLGLDALESAATKFEKWTPAKPSDPAKMGPATKALAEKTAAASAQRKEAAASKAALAAVAVDPVSKTAAKPAAKSATRPKPAMSVPAAAAADSAAVAAPKPARRKKSDT